MGKSVNCSSQIIDELNVITEIIADQVTADFTYKDAVIYQQDYFNALVNLKKEFKEEKKSMG